MFLDYMKKSHGDKVTFGRFNKNHGPDFKVELKDFSFLVECVVPGNADNPKNRITPCPAMQVTLANWQRELELRISHAVYEKKKQYGGWKDKGIVSGDEIFVLAIGLYDLSMPRSEEFADLLGEGFDIPFGLFGAFLPLGRERLSVNMATGLCKSDIPLRHYNEKFKNNGDKIKIEKNLFLNPEYEFISAVMFSYDHTEDIFKKSDGAGKVSVLHNPSARKPLRHGLISGKECRSIPKHDKWFFERNYD